MDESACIEARLYRVDQSSIVTVAQRYILSRADSRRYTEKNVLMSPTLSFFGGTREVTGSQYLLETEQARVLIDCGLHQGCHFCEGRNRKPFPYDPASINAVIVTHAHVDHTGLLPKLVREGFRGKIFATPPTRDFSEILLEDSVGIMRDEAKERREEPLYDDRAVAETIGRFTTVPYHEQWDILPGMSVTLYDAGHVLGSAIISIETEGKRIVFSGDLGNSPSPLLRDVETIDAADYVLVESVYGDRRHENRAKRREMLERVIGETLNRGGTLLIPVFAVERTQELLAELNTLVEEKRIPNTPVFLDSPLAVKATVIYQRYPDYYNDAARDAIIRGDVPFRFPGLAFTVTTEDSRAINDVAPPKIILAGSGMLSGGRVLHHARRYLPDQNSTLLILGYQAPGSLGRRLLAQPHNVRIFNEMVPVRAKVAFIGGYSGHADQPRLLKWLSAIQPSPKRTFVVQGEAAASLALRQEIREQLDREATVPTPGERIAFV